MRGSRGPASTIEVVGTVDLNGFAVEAGFSRSKVGRDNNGSRPAPAGGAFDQPHELSQ